MVQTGEILGGFGYYHCVKSKTSTMKLLKHLFFYSIFLLTTLRTDAAVATWIGGTGAWEDDNNWDIGTVPKMGDGVIINNGTVYIQSYAEANYIDLDGGDLIVEGMLLIEPSIPWYFPSTAEVRGIMIEYGSSLENYGSILIMEPSNFSDPSISIACNGSMTNHNSGFIFCQGDHAEGLHTYSQASTILNYGHMVLTGLDQGMYLISSFSNYGDIEIGCNDLAILNRATFYSGSSSTLETTTRLARVLRAFGSSIRKRQPTFSNRFCDWRVSRLRYPLLKRSPRRPWISGKCIDARLRPPKWMCTVASCCRNN